MIDFIKVHGLQNDFILLDEREGVFFEPKVSYIQHLCHRHAGIGADGILSVRYGLDGTKSDEVWMRLWNADGSEAQMCGNGLRSIALYLKRRGFWDQWAFEQKIYTLGGCFPIKFQSPLIASIDQNSQYTQMLLDDLKSRELVGIDMGIPKLQGSIEIEEICLDRLSFGNPHAVTFDMMAFENRLNLATKLYGYFDGGVNLSFAQKTGDRDIELFVYERGCGWTQACGTGACATVFEGVRQGFFEQNQLIKVKLPGGFLWIAVIDDSVEMWGEAFEVFEGKARKGD